MCEYCENIFVSNGKYNPASGRIEKIKTTKPMQCYAGDIRNDRLKTIWISNIRNCHELFCSPFCSNPILREEITIKAEINYCPMCGRKLKE